MRYSGSYVTVEWLHVNGPYVTVEVEEMVDGGDGGDGD